VDLGWGEVAEVGRGSSPVATIVSMRTALRKDGREAIRLLMEV
jgi:hypothetical protein